MLAPGSVGLFFFCFLCCWKNPLCEILAAARALTADFPGFQPPGSSSSPVRWPIASFMCDPCRSRNTSISLQRCVYSLLYKYSMLHFLSPYFNKAKWCYVNGSSKKVKNYLLLSWLQIDSQISGTQQETTANIFTRYSMILGLDWDGISSLWCIICPVVIISSLEAAVTRGHFGPCGYLMCTRICLCCPVYKLTCLQLLWDQERKPQSLRNRRGWKVAPAIGEKTTSSTVNVRKDSRTEMWIISGLQRFPAARRGSNKPVNIFYQHNLFKCSQGFCRSLQLSEWKS